MVAYLIPPKINATTQGECVFFDIDVKGGEKEWSRSDAIVGGPNMDRMLQLEVQTDYCSHSGLPSMPKGEIVGMFTVESNLFIDRKNNDEKISMINNAVIMEEEEKQ